MAGKRKFKADLDEVDVQKRNLQQVLALVDEAKGLTHETAVRRKLAAAHSRLCLGITFLTDEASRNGGYGVAPTRAS